MGCTEHPFFTDHPSALRLHLYEDEVVLVNPIGPKRTKYKICAFYYTVGNVSRKYCSNLSHIHLALLVRHSFVKAVGLETILRPLTDDLKMLSTEGFTLIQDGVEHTMHAALTTISCDNLSAHMIGGFSMCFSSGRICRYCMATYSEIQHKFCEERFVIRTSEIHKYHKNCVKNDKKSAAVYGVHGNCAFDTALF